MGDFLEEQRRRMKIMLMMEREDEHTELEADNHESGKTGREESVVGIVEEMAERILDDEAIMMDVGRLKCVDELLSGQFTCGICQGILVNATRMNLECAHVFCGSCATMTWSKHYEGKSMEGRLVQRESRFQCPYCRRECTRIPDLEERNKENIPFVVDRGVNRIMDAMIEEGRGTAARIVEKMEKDLHKLGENEEIVKGWEAGGLMETDRGSRSGASVDAMDRFERYWQQLETNEIFERLGQFEVTERDGRGALPESPERRARRGGMARKRRRVVQQRLHEVLASMIDGRRDRDRGMRYRMPRACRVHGSWYHCGIQCQRAYAMKWGNLTVGFDEDGGTRDRQWGK
ncbi:hypothetical protein L210DRAFT_3509278 [Boletus edulis BED1]|uniref:RING-type domain-containing protein n=1 Tax=Boletus edulis BED1 TaxID=1328754 RepID=A0AAD4BF72_BOLED|nr:hypothetical protein L210DRAFT_3509278 [Boletus edulis BED1]